jgi:hypothetical protein
MADQGICKFLGAVVLGGKMTLSRGVRPSRGKLYLLPETTFDRKVGLLEFAFPSGGSIQFPDSALLTNTFRPHPNHNRDAWRWSVQVVDRRWKWKYARINGTYNESGLLPRRDSIKNLKQLMELCLDAMGETNYDTSAVPDSVSPPVVWNVSRADLELQWLCDLIGFIPVLKTTTNTVSIEPLNDTTGANLPSGGEITPGPTVSTWKSAVIPQNLRVQGDPTIYQSELTLSPYGLETDGKIKPIADLSYKPAGGWTDQWPWHFPDVVKASRHLALQTVFRWFVPTTGWKNDISVSSFEQIELLDTTIERVADGDGVDRPVPPRVRGTFWPYSDLDNSTPANTVYNGNFKIDSHKGVVIFEQPVFQLVFNIVAVPILKLTCAYRVREDDGDGYAVYIRDLAVSKSNSTTKHRILHHPELAKEDIEAPIYGAISDNETAIETAADVYLTNIEKTYDFEASQDVTYSGLVIQDLDGAIAQLEYRAGRGMAATTRIGRFTEIDITTMHHQQRRALERLAQMAQKMGV